MGNEQHVLLRRKGETQWRQPGVGSYVNERELQELLMASPDLLPGVGGALVVDEFHLPGTGSVDLVVVEPSGAVTLVECKLAANAESRRTVIGQVLSYAAGMWKTTYEQLDDRVRARVGMSLSTAISEVADAEEWDEEEFRQRISAVLSRGSFRLFVAVDTITDELRSIIEFLNTHTSSDLEVLAFELGYVADENTEILLPRTYGEESARVRSTTPKSQHQWTTADVMTSLVELISPAALAGTRKLHDELVGIGARFFPGKGSYPTMSAHVRLRGDRRAACAIYADPSGPGAARLSLNFGSWRENLTEDELTHILQRLQRHEALAPHLQNVQTADFKIWPTVPLEVLADDDVVRDIIDLLTPHVQPL